MAEFSDTGYSVIMHPRHSQRQLRLAFRVGGSEQRRASLDSFEGYVNKAMTGRGIPESEPTSKRQFQTAFSKDPRQQGPSHNKVRLFATNRA